MKVPRGFSGRKKPRIEMLPLIDIVFLLLIFFIYAMLSMAVHRAIDLSLPFSATAEITPETHLAVSIRADGAIFLDDTEVAENELRAILRQKVLKKATGESLQVDLFADRTISYQRMYRVLDAIRSAGIANVSLQSSTAQ